ncbi:MAG: choice-of-anchor V domain-containing protein [Bacteroidia bacterium]
MVKKYILLILLALPVLSFVDIVSNGAPPGSTGAPGEPNCTKSGCHQDFPVNSGPGNASLQMGGGTNTYVPGQTYTLTASVTQGTLVRFGFQVVALADRDSSNAGTFHITESSRTQIIPGFGTLASRDYMTYTFGGSSAKSTGLGQWTFTWTAPAADIGPITLYLAGIAGNDDGTDMGDYGYLSSIQLLASPAGIRETEVNTSLELFPNPATDQILISCFLDQETRVEIELFDIRGQKLACLYSETKAPGAFKKDIKLNNTYPEGVYLLRINKGNRSQIRKILLSR